MTIYNHLRDIPQDLTATRVAVDTELTGLHLVRDRVCLVQLSVGDGHAHLVQIERGQTQAPNLKRLMEDAHVEKILHYARADMAMLLKQFDIHTRNVFCTKIASKMARTYSERHGLKDLVKELLGKDLNKQMTTTDWGQAQLSDEQKLYAADDVLYLHAIRDRLYDMLMREGRWELVQSCFTFLPTRVMMDVMGYQDLDIFAFSSGSGN